jgi:hypothetical protein
VEAAQIFAEGHRGRLSGVRAHVEHEMFHAAGAIGKRDRRRAQNDS